MVDAHRPTNLCASVDKAMRTEFFFMRIGFFRCALDQKAGEVNEIEPPDRLKRLHRPLSSVHQPLFSVLVPLFPLPQPLSALNGPVNPVHGLLSALRRPLSGVHEPLSAAFGVVTKGSI